MSPPPPKDEDNEAQPRDAGAEMNEPWCHNCGGQLNLLVHVEPRTNGRPVNYYTCERCAQVMVCKS